MKKNVFFKAGILLLTLLLLPGLSGCGAISSPLTTQTPSDPLSMLVETVATVANGKGIPEAKGYDPETSEPSKLVLITQSGESHPANMLLPPELFPSKIEEVSLVGIVSPEQERLIEKCGYIGGPPIERYYFWIYVKLYDAKSGRFVGAPTISGSDPESCPQKAPVQQIRLDGEHVSDETLASQLICYLTSPQNCPIPKLYLHGEGQILYQESNDLVEIEQVALSPHGQIIAAAVWNAVKLMEIPDGRLLRNLKHEDVALVTFSPDGQFIASGGRDNIVRLWRVSDGYLLHTLEHPGWITAISFSPDGQMLASTSLRDSSIHLWQVPGGSKIKTIQLDFFYRDKRWESIAFSPDGQLLALGGDYIIPVLRLSDGKLFYQLSGHEDRSTSISFSSDGQTLASASYDGTIRLWRMSTGAPMHLFGKPRNEEYFPAPVYDVDFSPDGKVVASASGHEIQVWNVSEGSLVGVLVGHNDTVSSLTFSSDGKTIVSSSNDGTIRLWDMVPVYSAIQDLSKQQQQNQPDSSSLPLTLAEFSSPVTAVDFSPSGQILASGSADGTVVLWQVIDGIKLCTLDLPSSDAVADLEFSPDGTAIATAMYNDVFLSSVSDCRFWGNNFWHYNQVTSVAFSPDGQLLASGSHDNEPIRVWRVADDSLENVLAGHSDWVLSVSYSPDGQILASGGQDKSVKLWQSSDGFLLLTLNHEDWVTSLDFSPDGKTIASGTASGTVYLWRISDGALLRKLNHSQWVSEVVFSPDGRLLVVGSGKNIYIWQVSDGVMLNTLTGHIEAVTGLSFSPNGQILASGSRDQTIRLWHLP